MKIAILFLRVEGLALLLFVVLAYYFTGLSWWWFALGLLVPDISMVGYLVSSKLGAYAYNLGHSLIVPLLIVGIGYINKHSILSAIGLIWIAHIGLDRVFGYGLKEEQGFHHTHLGRIGKSNG